MKNSNTRYLTIGAAFVMIFLTAAVAYAVTATPYNAANGKLAVALCLGIAALWFCQQRPSRPSATDASAGIRQRDDDEDALDPSP